jgi:hypothetical protein
MTNVTPSLVSSIVHNDGNIEYVDHKIQAK